MRWRAFRDDRCGAGMTGAFTKIGLIPAAPDCAYDASSLAVTGRLDPTPNVAGTGAWKEALLVGGDPGGPGVRSPSEEPQQCRSGRRSRLANKARPLRSCGVESQGSGGAETRTGPQIAERGC